MAQFGAAQVGVSATASATNLNNYVFTLLTAGNIGSVKMISWGGSDTSLVARDQRGIRTAPTDHLHRTDVACGEQGENVVIQVCRTRRRRNADLCRAKLSHDSSSSPE